MDESGAAVLDRAAVLSRWSIVLPKLCGLLISAVPARSLGRAVLRAISVPELEPIGQPGLTSRWMGSPLAWPLGGLPLCGPSSEASGNHRRSTAGVALRNLDRTVAVDAEAVASAWKSARSWRSFVATALLFREALRTLLSAIPTSSRSMSISGPRCSLM